MVKCTQRLCDKCMTTDKNIHVDKFKTVQVKRCLLVNHADKYAPQNVPQYSKGLLPDLSLLSRE